MRNHLFCAIGIIVALSLCVTLAGVDAASGTPGSPRFGYGTHLNIDGQQIETAIQTAGSLDLDWIAVDFDWACHCPEVDSLPEWESLDRAISLAEENRLSILVSITKPPAWALTSDGPSLPLTTALIQELACRYPGTLMALELFPGANTSQGWGAQPNPQAYAELLEAVHGALQSAAPGIFIVAAGIAPLMDTNPSGDIDDLTFMQALYAAGAAPFMPVIGMRLPKIGLDPTISPAKIDGITLRHYEAVRNVMLQNGHRSGLIWITGFSWDANAISSPADQAIWLKQAYLMMRGQLYIGAAFFQNLNPSATDISTGSLMQVDASLHPAFKALGQLIALENSHQTVTFKMILLKKASAKIEKHPLFP